MRNICNLARVDSKFLLLNNQYEKFLYIMSANSNVCIIAKGVYNMYQLRISLLYK